MDLTMDLRVETALEERIPAWVEGRLVPVGKLEVHQRGLRHMAVSVFVTEGARVLIQRRAAGKYHTPLLWANTCCTHPRWDEDPAACAVRRLREELGITGLFPAFADRVEYRADVGGGLTEHEVVDIFLAEAAQGQRVDPNPEEVAEVRWIDLYDLAAEAARTPERFTPWLRIYLAEHLDRIFGTGMLAR
jgi:isopentenyl-diphosphate Delta-isomerase